VAAFAAVVFGTFVEYFIHRSMHWGILHAEGHRYHHETNDPRTFVRDFLDYGFPALLLSWPGFLISLASGLGWAFGALLYTVLASYSHQIQHANADLVFWMKRPVHRLHHVHDMKDKNFGILVDWWDRLFGTYEPVEWPRTTPPEGYGLKHYRAIPWV
jgi:sterol desaturase/sphingolipid hydroxylase (fatty acid hydroxylase superfamily)